jgi:hypothetical protein
VVILGGLFVLASFTIHFGGFRYIHSQFLIAFFPINGEQRTASLPICMEVARRYWWVLPSAFLAERDVFLRRTSSRASAPADMSATPDAIAARKTASARKSAGRMTAPYRRVMRMSVLITLFGLVHAGGWTASQCTRTCTPCVSFRGVRCVATATRSRSWMAR